MKDPECNKNNIYKRVRQLEKESARQNIRIKELQRVVEVLVATL